jgi:hypothetical protein
MVTKMKMLPKLWKLLSIVILLIGINSNACFGEAQGLLLPNRPGRISLPLRDKCLDLLELERIRANPQDDTITYNASDRELARDYYSVTGWLAGFFTAWNFNSASDGDVTKGAATYQVMAWIFSYCRAHPSGDLVNAAYEFMNAMSKTKN